MQEKPLDSSLTTITSKKEGVPLGTSRRRSNELNSSTHPPSPVHGASLYKGNDIHRLPLSLLTQKTLRQRFALESLWAHVPGHLGWCGFRSGARLVESIAVTALVVDARDTVMSTSRHSSRAFGSPPINSGGALTLQNWKGERELTTNVLARANITKLESE